MLTMVNHPDLCSVLHLSNWILIFREKISLGEAFFFNSIAFLFILNCICPIIVMCMNMNTCAPCLAMAQLRSLPLDSEAFTFSVLQTVPYWDVVQFFFTHSLVALKWPSWTSMGTFNQLIRLVSCPGKARCRSGWLRLPWQRAQTVGGVGCSPSTGVCFLTESKPDSVKAQTESSPQGFSAPCC